MDGSSIAPASASGQDIPSQPLFRKHRRPALSCVRCRRRKVKCDRNMPCNRCSQSKNTFCVYEPARDIIQPRVTMPSQSLHTSAPSIPDEHSSAASLGRTLLSSQLPLGQPTQPTISLQAPQSEPSVEDLKDRVRQLEQMMTTLVHSDQTTTNSATLDAVTSAPILRGRLDKTRFYGMGHWMNIKKEFDAIDSLKSGTLSDRSSEIPKILKSCKDMARAVKAQRPTGSFIAPDFKSQIPSRETSDLLVGHYFRSFESTYRILHRQLFYKEYEQYLKNPQSADTFFIIKLLLVMAIGTLPRGDGTDNIDLRDLVPQWIYSAQNWLNSPYANSRVTLGRVEIQCLMLLAQNIHSLDKELTWISVGSLIRIAMSVGLHRDPDHFPKMTIMYAELRRRLWATVLELAIQSSLDCGMPPLFSFHDFDCKLPSNYNDVDIDENTKEYPQRKADAIFTETSIQISLSRSLRTRLEICTLINDFHSRPSYEKVLSLGTELTSHIRSYSQLNRASRDSQVPFTVSHMNLLDLLARRFLLALHLPFAVKARTNAEFYFSRKVALETAMGVLACPETGDSAEDFIRMKLTSGGYFRETFSRASAAVGLELINQINEDSSFASLHGPSPSSLLRKPLHEAVEAAVTWSRGRLKSADTNVKLYVFLSMVQAQTLAMERGEDVKNAIAEASKRSTEEAYGILRKQIIHTPVDGPTPASSNGMSSGIPGIDNCDWDVLMQDANMDFGIGNTWLFDNWEDIPNSVSTMVVAETGRVSDGCPSPET